MGFNRVTLMDGGLERVSRPGDGTHMDLVAAVNATAGALTITTAQVLAGLAAFSGAAGAVAYTLPLAADLIAAMPFMDIGDTFTFIVANSAAQAATITTNTGWTVTGVVVANAGFRIVVVTKLTATTLAALCL